MENQKEAGGTNSFLLPPKVSARRKTWIERRRPAIMRVLVIEMILISQRLFLSGWRDCLSNPN